MVILRNIRKWGRSRILESKTRKRVLSFEILSNFRLTLRIHTCTRFTCSCLCYRWNGHRPGIQVFSDPNEFAPRENVNEIVAIVSTERNSNGHSRGVILQGLSSYRFALCRDTILYSDDLAPGIPWHLSLRLIQVNERKRDTNNEHLLWSPFS